MQASIAINNRCNFKCKMCDYGNHIKTKGLSTNWDTIKELIPIEWKKIFDDYGIKKVHINGVEPLLYQYIDSFLQLFNSSLYVHITTNGWYIDRYLKNIFDNVNYLTVSIDGLRETHDKIRGVKGSFDKAISGVEKLRALGMKNIRISFAITPDNIKDIKEVYNISKKLGIKMIFNHYNYIAGETNLGYNLNEINLEELNQQIRECELANFSPYLKNLRELNIYYKTSPYKLILKKCAVIEQTLLNKHCTLNSEGKFIISARCWMNISSEDLLSKNNEFLNFASKIQKGLPYKCQRLCCAGKAIK